MTVITSFLDVVAGVSIIAGRSSLLDTSVFKTANSSFSIRQLLAVGFIGVGGWNLWNVQKAQNKLKKTLGAESFSAESGQMCEVCFGNDDLPYDSDHFTNCGRCGKSVCMDCDGEMEYHPDWFKVCGECDTILENVSIHGAENAESFSADEETVVDKTEESGITTETRQYKKKKYNPDKMKTDIPADVLNQTDSDDFWVAFSAGILGIGIGASIHKIYENYGNPFKSN